jgi:hypothetical protein
MSFRNSDWNTTLIEERTSIPPKITWKCENAKENITKTVTTKLKETKIFPEEDYEYEGTINGKKVEGKATYGNIPTNSIHAVKENEQLTDAEKYAGYSHINWFANA